MDLPSLAVRRPVLIVVVNLLIVIGGLAALAGVEVRELPDVDSPVVTVRADYEGAAPETVDAEVTSRLEGAVARVPGVDTIESSSEEGNARVRVSFRQDVDLDTAANDVREAVADVERRLPDGVDNVTVVKADDDADPVIRLSLISDTLAAEDLTRLAEDEVAAEIAAVPGVASVEVYGARERILRVIVDPLRLASYGLGVDAVAEALRRAELDVPAGSFTSRDQSLLVRAEASVWREEDIAALPVRDGVRVGEVAQVIYGPAAPDSSVRLDGRPVVGMGVIRQAQSNTIAISDGVEAAVERLNRTLDEATLVKTSDDALFIRGSVREVGITLGLATAVVIAVIYLFLGAFRPTLIPAVTIPVSIAGTIAAIWLLGFSINILTLLALVLATGMIVDDAIVVLENIQRQRARGLKPLAAAVTGTRQVFFAVMATTATLVSVFLPIAFLPSEAGRLFTEFGFVLAIAVAISSFVALTLCPMMASRLDDRPEDAADGDDAESEAPGAPPSTPRPPALTRALAPAGRRLAALYDRLLAGALSARLLTLGLAAASVAAAVVLFGSIDRELLPDEDRGRLFIFMSGPDGVAYDYMDRQAAEVEAALEPMRESGEVEGVLTIVGAWDPNIAFVIAPLAPWSERERSQFAIADEIRAAVGDIPGASVRVGSSNSLSIRGAGSGFEFALLGSNYDDIAAAGDTFIAAIQERLPGLTDLRLSYQPTQPQLSVTIDRRRAEDLGVPAEGLASTLRAMVDGFEVAEITVDDRTVPIMLESAAGTIDDPSDLDDLFVPTDGGRMVPLSAFVDITETGVAAELDRTRQRRAIEVDAGLAQGYTLADAIADLDALGDEVLPPGVQLAFLGEAAELEETGREIATTFAIAIVVVLLVLAAQFESFLSATVVILTVPFGLAAAVLALFLTGTSLNVYSQIGLVLLVGLMAKNGILIVEFADQLRDRGFDARRAVRDAARERLRPVMMTMLSTVLGALPLILSTGPGAEARAAIGWVIFGGLGIATLFTLFLTPVFYSLLAPYARARAHGGAALAREMRESEAIAEFPATRAAE
ncbi:MAG: efflux RND transporter permease subunit [Azospirillaceae bacterium]